ncbi:MAG: sulfatase-like hydrolase/transferase [Chloroflexi bacterium]|nr:sulfatase-like hydrolase/transferase [Chloroflexota bacterium]
MSGGRPHILLITCDELRADALSCYGNRVITTPNLDALAASGTRFERAYSNSPWCLPSRCSLSTGLYPHRNGAYSNFRDVPLDATIPNIYSLLGGAGYHRAHIGKCHYAPVPYAQTRPDATLPYDEFRDYYLSLGIDHLALQDDKQVSVWFMDDYARELEAAGHLSAYRDATWNRDKAKVFPFPGPAEWHPDSWVGRKSAAYVDAYRSEQPLFLWVSFSGPHYPFDAPAEYYERVDMSADARVASAAEFNDPSRIHSAAFHGGPTGAIDGLGQAPGRATKNFSEDYWQDLRRNYFANVAQIDDYVGRITAAVQARFGDEALVIFTADHGEMLGNHGLWGKNNCAYEDVWNVPLMVKHPGGGEALASDAMCMLVDLLPTCLDAAGLPYDFCDGLPLRERIASGGAEFVYAEGEGFLALSDGRYKLTRVAQGERQHTELIDLEEDPYEFVNRIDDPALQAEVARLQARMVDLLMDEMLK